MVESGGGRISFYSPTGTLLRQVGTPGEGDGELLGAADAVADADGTLYVADQALHRIVTFDADGNHLATFGAHGAHFGEFNGPRALALDNDKNLHIVDRGNRRVQVFTRGGEFVRSYGADAGDGALESPWTVSLDPLGNAWVADPKGGAVQVYGPDGAHLLRFANLVIGGVEVQPLRAAVTADGGVYVHVNLIAVEA